ncbi:unnamed protein product [Heterosigma akashiwo]|uniref:Glutaredoxin domain-containing protein n=1 Tax=Heterosigma akashiwo TaxID=2829 RepID=A0A6S9FTA2_HETAK
MKYVYVLYIVLTYLVGTVLSFTQSNVLSRTYVKAAPTRPNLGARGMMMADQAGIVTMYIKSTCPFCKEAKALLEGEYGLNLTVVDVLEGEEGEQKAKQRQMKQFSFRKTVPQIFFNSKHLGGNDDVQTLHREGALAALVAAMNAEGTPRLDEGWYHPHY